MYSELSPQPGKPYIYFLDVADEEGSLGLRLLESIALQCDGLTAGGSCCTVNITADGHLICGTAEGVVIRDAHTLDTISLVKHTSTERWEEMIQPEGVVVGSFYNENSAEVVALDPTTLQMTRSLYKYSVDDLILLGRIAQQNSLVYVVESKKKQLVVCSLADNSVLKLQIPGMKNPHPVCILPDSTLLLGDRSKDGGVSRYKMENTTLTLMWEFPHISVATGISFDPTSKLIYICTLLGPLFIISLKGK